MTSVIALTGVSLHVSVLTWRQSKDEAMCKSWDSPGELDRYVSERREQGRGPGGIFVRPASGDQPQR